jgi:lipopolysaccharide export system permease protein
LIGGILFRMILWELSKVFLMSLIGITGILLMAGIIAEATQQGLGPGQILAAIPLLIPSTLPYTIPATTLFATCVVYGRLAADNEILAIKAAGVNLFKIVKPGIILGLAMSASTLALYYHVIPYTHLLLRTMIFNDLEELAYSGLRKAKVIKSSKLPYDLYVYEVRGRKLLWPIIKHKNDHGQVDYVISAREAELKIDTARRELHIQLTNGDVTGTNTLYFANRTEILKLPDDFGRPALPRPRDMIWQELLRNREELCEDECRMAAELAVGTTRILLQDIPQSLPGKIAALNETLPNQRQQVLAIDVELQMRPALSLGCLCFILVGCPVGIWFSKSDYLSAFITCFLPICFLYYPLLLCGTGMARDGRMAILPLVWGADGLVGLMGLFLFYKLLRN